MAISYSWNVHDMNWDSSSGMILNVTGRFVGIKTCTVGTASTTFLSSVYKRVSLNCSNSSEFISIDSITEDNIIEWLNQELFEEIPSFKKQIYDNIFPLAQQYLQEQHVSEYVGIGTIQTIRGGMSLSYPNENWGPFEDYYD